ncbi:MAG: hypothetical protein HOO93_07840 [Methyloglobulus sp.]|nr:hypothetical protein [Methyloglobulus sp.]
MHKQLNNQHMGKHHETKRSLLARINRSLLLNDWFLSNFEQVNGRLMKWLTPLFVILVEHSRYSVQSQAYCLILTMGFCGKRPPKDQLILYSEFTVGNLDFFKS